jgi:hypothetical protein
MKMHPVSSDKRYTINKEFCGYSEARYVLRFCDEWIMQSQFYSSALVYAVCESARRQGALIVVEKTA